MIRRCTLWMAAVLAVFAVTAAQAAEDVFHVIPSDALAFVAVNRMAETSAKVQKLAKQVGAPPVGLLDLAKDVHRRQEGPRRNPQRRAGGHARQDRKGEPAPVFLIPVADYKQFLESWDAKRPTNRGQDRRSEDRRRERC